MKFSDALRYLRSELGLTQTELANDLHINYATVSRWERGKTYPNRAMLLAVMDYAKAHSVSKDCADSLERAIKSIQKEKLDLASSEDYANAALSEEIVDVLLSMDYETILTIDPKTGKPQLFLGEHLGEVIAEQEAVGDNVAGVEAYLRKYCANDDVDRVIKETSLPYVKEQLQTKAAFTVTYSINSKGKITHKRVLYTYLDRGHTKILCAMQNITELYNNEIIQKDQIAAALQTLQEQGGIDVARYDLKTKVFYSNSRLTANQGYGEAVENVPEEFIEKGFIAPSSVDEYCKIYDRLNAGATGTYTIMCKAEDGTFHWTRVNTRLIYDRDQKPYQAIMTFKDIEEEREQAVIYKKWRQSIEHRKPGAYTLFRCNLSKGSSADKVEGALLQTELFDPDVKTFNERTQDYAGRFVHLDDFEAYTTLLNSENLLAGYYRGTNNASMDYRERIGGKGSDKEEYRWLHLSVEIARYPDSPDVEVFLMYERTDKEHLEDPELKARINADPLTGVLNRRAFIEDFTALITEESPEAKHALILVDVDGFKRINEGFGHAVGDQTLKSIAESLQSVVRKDDLVGRLGGDEFLICLKDVAGQAAVEQKAMQILATMRKAFSIEIRITASLGITFYPNDGDDFETLYHNVDQALYTARQSGRDSFAFYSVGPMRAEKSQKTEQESLLQTAQSSNKPAAAKRKVRKQHMILVDDDRDRFDLVKSVFEDKYSIEVCTDEKRVMPLLHRYGATTSVVLLNINLASVDGLALLKRIRNVKNIDFIPVIAISEVDKREKCLKSLKQGANDFVLIPIEAELLKIRVDSAVGKIENERLRAQNEYLQIQRSDAAQFRAVYENTDTIVVEYDWKTHVFTYDPAISTHLFGRYDDRSLWQILMSDMVADVQDVKMMQEFIMKLADSGSKTSGKIDVMLKTPSKAKHWFTLQAFKRVDEMNMPSKIIITFLDTNEEVLAGKKLRFQAEHDSLTGLYNRAQFLKLLEETVRTEPKNSYILICCDINDFRFINERYGREEGDRLLQYCAEKLLMYANSVGSFAGRLSNDVFAILLLNEQGMLRKATAAVQSFFADYPSEAKITGRAGAYMISDPDMASDIMLDCASTASKSIKGQFDSWLALYDESMSEERLREKDISDRMEIALLDGQFDVYLQPQFNHGTGQIVGAEALVRWIDPKHGVVAPAEFIPIFEKNGFITKMDEYVWEKTAEYVSAWMARGNEPVPVSVNVSREDTKDPALCSKLLAIVKKYNIPIHIFRLEITESLFSEDTKRLVSVVEELHEAGFLIEMDDFGSGYSSLNILKDVPVDILKLDMKFFSGSDNFGRGGMIINAVLRMSRWLGIPVIAEGVEIREHADFLMSIGCSTIQGYLYERPMPTADFEKMLLERGDKQAVIQDAISTEIDAASFWDPHSADSQLFNNYIGPALVFEYHNGGYDVIRMNQRFAHVMQLKDTGILSVSEIMRIYEEDKPMFKKAIMEIIYSGKDIKLDIRFNLGVGNRQKFHVHLNMMAKSSERALIFASLEAR